MVDKMDANQWLNLGIDFLENAQYDEAEEAIQRALEVVKAGGVISFPTDTVYGIGVSAYQEDAIKKVYQVKERSHLKAIPILIYDAEVLEQITTNLLPITDQIINHFWPGPLTLVLPKGPDLPNNLSQTDTIGVRVPDDNLTRELLRQSGPLAATSANLRPCSPALAASTAAFNASRLV